MRKAGCLNVADFDYLQEARACEIKTNQAIDHLESIGEAAMAQQLRQKNAPYQAESERILAATASQKKDDLRELCRYLVFLAQDKLGQPFYAGIAAAVFVVFELPEEAVNQYKLADWCRK